MSETTELKPKISASSNAAQNISFESLYKAYYRKVAAIVFRFNFFDGNADDLIQDIFIQAWRCRASLQNESSFGPWIKAIARNRCLNELRKRKPTVPVDTVDGNVDDDEHIILEADDESKTYHFEYSLQLLCNLIKHHKSEPRATIARFFYLDHLSVKAIAVKLDMPENTVLSHLRRFRLSISKAMLRLVEEHNLDLSNI